MGLGKVGWTAKGDGVGDGLGEEVEGGGVVAGFDLEADAADEVRDLPIEADEVFVAEVDDDAGGFEEGPGDDGFGEVAVVADGGKGALGSFSAEASSMRGGSRWRQLNSARRAAWAGSVRVS